jgi:type II secretory pathway pseudopilin PulG
MPYKHRRTHTQGMSLIEVMVSVLLVTVIILGALMVRYYAVKHGVRADAYETAARVGQLLLEGWRSTDLDVYDPNDRFPDQLLFVEAADGPDVAADGFTTYVTPTGISHYDITLDHRHYYATLGYKPAVVTVGAEVPPMIHVAVAFENDYGTWDTSDAANYVKLTSYK